MSNKVSTMSPLNVLREALDDYAEWISAYIESELPARPPEVLQAEQLRDDAYAALKDLEDALQYSSVLLPASVLVPDDGTCDRCGGATSTVIALCDACREEGEA